MAKYKTVHSKQFKTIRRSLYAAIFTLCLMELGVRIVLEVPGFDYFRKTKVRVYYSQSYAKLLVPDQEIFSPISPTTYNLEQLQYKINSAGLRGPNIEWDKAEEALRIILIGGSHIFDIYCSKPNGASCFTSRIEEELRQNGIKAEVLNAGIPGQDIKNIILRLQDDIKRLEPDYIILSSIFNDVRWINFTDTTNFAQTLKDITGIPQAKLGINPFIEPYGTADAMLGWSKLFMAARHKYWLYRMGQFIEEYTTRFRKPDQATGLQLYAEYAQQFVDLTKEMGAHPIIAFEERYVSPMQPESEVAKNFRMRYLNNQRIEHSVIVNTYAKCDAILAETAIKNNVPIIDFRHHFQGKEHLFSDIVHTTRAGSNLMGELYSQKLTQIMLNTTSNLDALTAQ